MKKNKYLTFVALAAAALATSCTSDDIAGQQQGQNQSKNQTVTLTASVNEMQTRMGMAKGENSTASFYWHKGDAISVLTYDETNNSSGTAKFTTEDADGTLKATFTGEVTGTVSKYAIYPYHENDGVVNSQLNCYLPTEYNYSKVESNIFSKDGSYPSNPTNMPMLGTISGSDDNKSISFKCMGGLAVIRIDQMPAESGTLTVTADQQLSGQFFVDYSTPSITTTATSTAADQQVTFKFRGATANGVGVFYLPLATGSYSGVKIAVTCGGNTQNINYGNLCVERSSVTAIPLYTISNKLTKFSKIDGNVYTLNGREFIDLGLSVLWAKTNVGADTETGYGNYYACGETEPKDTYTSGNQKYMGNPTTLDAEHDAATVNWGSSCRLPTKEEFEELNNNCTWDWASGYKVTSNKTDYTSQSIFLPAAGYWSDSANRPGSQGFYRSSSIYSEYFSWVFWYKQNTHTFTQHNRQWGCTVRAVTEK